MTDEKNKKEKEVKRPHLEHFTRTPSGEQDPDIKRIKKPKQNGEKERK
nr:MAG TPA: hypothetical protein [Caudoviricetes sp.]